MRPLSPIERDINWFADRVDESRRRQLLSDLENAKAEVLGSTIRFHIDGYARPPYRGERPLPVEAIVLDADGAILSVVIVEDENGRLFELQVIRYEYGDIIGPVWETLRTLLPKKS